MCFEKLNIISGYFDTSDQDSPTLQAVINLRVIYRGLRNSTPFIIPLTSTLTRHLYNSPLHRLMHFTNEDPRREY